MTKRARITLRIVGENLDPDAITRLLGVSPTECFRRGDPRGQTAESRGIPRRQHGGWLLTKDVADRAEIDAALRSMCALFPPAFPALPEGLGSSADLFVGLFDVDDQDSLSIEPGTSQLLAERGLPLVFDMYIADTYIANEER